MTQNYSFAVSDAAVRSPAQDHDTNAAGVGNSDLQEYFRSIIDCNAGTSEPFDAAAGVPWDGMLWLDQTNRLLKIYSTTKTGGAGWVDLFEVDDGQPISAPSADASTAWPIGSVYLQANGPNVNHAFGTWVPFAPGRFLACVGSTSDPSGSWTVAADSTGGRRYITLNSTNIPAHTHPFSVPATTSFNVSVGQGAVTSEPSGTFSGTTSVQSGTTGQAFDAMPPYTAVYAFRRTG